MEERLKFIKVIWMASSCHLPNDSFSPESGGKVNPNNAIEAISTHGTIKLKK